MDDQNGSDAAEGVRAPIVRDPTFVRFVADEIIFSDLGRDMEVSFLQYGPLYQYRVGMEDVNTFESDDAITEVARMRISFPSLVSLAMNLISYGVVNNRLKSEAVRASFDAWIEEALERRASEKND